MVSKNQILYVSLIFVSFTFVLSAAFSQDVTNVNTINESSLNTNKINQSTRITIIDIVGDIDCSNNLHNQVKKDNVTLFIALGDLCYKSDLGDFKNTFGVFKNSNRLSCVRGNHESEEDGDPQIIKQAREYCKDPWYRKIANNTTLLIGLNTNGDTRMQTQWGNSLVTNSTLMKGVKNIMLLAHKPANAPFESYHPPRNSTIQMISGIESNISKSIKVYEIAAHNHFMAKSSDGRLFISGAGGRNHHEGTSSLEWPFVNKKDFGYLQIRINNTDGKVISTHFIGIDGRPIH